MYQPSHVLLSDQERAIADASGFGATQGLGQRPALLVIDVNYKFVGERDEPILESIKHWPTSCGERGWAAVPQVQACLEWFRERHLPVFYTTGDDRQSGMAHGRWAGKNTRVGGARQDEAAGNRIVEAISPQAGETVLRKTKPSAFFGTPLMSYLQELGVDTLIMTGGTTSGCVRATAVDAFSYNFKVGVVQDAVFDRLATSHEISLFDLSLKYADVLSASAVEDYLKALSGGETT